MSSIPFCGNLNDKPLCQTRSNVFENRKIQAFVYCPMFDTLVVNIHELNSSRMTRDKTRLIVIK